MLARKFLFPVTLFAVITVLLAPALRAQDATAKILGQVVDPQGSIVPEAAITVTNVDTNVTNNAKTDKNGAYQVNQLPIGNYKVSANKEGFAVANSPTYKLEINQSQRVDIKLAVAGTTATVDVSIQAAVIDTVSSTVGGSVTERPLVDLPLNGRNILDLAKLQPGVTEGSNPGNTSAGTVSISGGRTDSVTYLLDGGNNNGLLNNGVVFNPNPDAVEEFRILENNYAAEYGRNGGGVISVVTKSGTHRYHGSVFEFNRNNAFNANSYFNKRSGLPVDVLKRNQFGGTIGGEIFVPRILPRKDRFFFFFAYEGQRLSETVSPGAQQVATSAEAMGDFSHSGVGGVPDPAVAQFLHDNPYFQPDPAKAALAIIDTSRIDATAQKYITAGLFPSSPTGNISPVGSGKENFDQYSGKLDFIITQNDRLSVSLARNNQIQISPFSSLTRTGVASTLPFPISNPFGAYVANIGYTRTFTPNVVNEARFVAQRFNRSQAIPVGNKYPTPAQLGIGITPDQVTGPTRLYFLDSNVVQGYSVNGPTNIIDNTFAYSDNVTWVRGLHNFKFGGYFSPYQNNTVYDYYVNGEFDFYGLSNISSSDPRSASIGSSTGFAEFLTGSPDEYIQFGKAPSNVRSKSTALFAQDEWHVTRNLTLNLGLRYEYASPKYDTKGRSFSLIAGQQSTRFTGAPRGLLFPGDKGAPKGANFSDKKNFAPRFGFALDPRGDGKTVVRGGVGLFYDILKAEDNLQFNGQGPFFGYSDLLFNSPTGQTSPTGYYQDPYGSTGSVNTFPSKPPVQNLDFGAAGFLPFGGGGVFFVDPRLHTPYTIQYNFGLQRDVFRGVTFEAAYVGSVSRKYTVLADANPFILGTTDRLYNQINGLAANPGNAYSYLDTFRNLSYENYNSLQVQLRKNSSNILHLGNTYFQLSYTYAKNMDNASGFRQRSAEVPSFNPSQFYAVSDLNVPNRVVFSGGWDLPFEDLFPGGPKFLTKGWSLYPIASYQSGYPIDVPANFNRNRRTPGPSNAGDGQLVRVNLTGNKIDTLNPYKNVSTDGVGLQYVSGSNFNRDGLNNVATNDPNLGITPGLSPISANPSYGTLGRNSFYGPGHPNIDLSVAKVTRLFGGEPGLQLELRGDFFNVANFTELQSPNAIFTSKNFGEITTTYDPRIIQLAGKLRF